MANYSLTGALVTDEAVACATSEVIEAETYYTGQVAQITNNGVAGNSHATYGIWTAVSQGGTRQEVILEGLPSADQVAWDIETGKLISPTSQTVYCTYLAFGSYATEEAISAMAASGRQFACAIGGGAEVAAYPSAPAGIIEIVEEGGGGDDVTIDRITVFARTSSPATGNTVLQFANAANPAAGGVTTATVTLNSAASGETAYWGSTSTSMLFSNDAGTGRLYVRFTTANNHANFTITARAS